MSVVTMKALLESGVHFGHQTHKWNPKMDKYIFIKRNGIHILDLKQTLDAVNEAYMFIKESVSKGNTVLFVGTKKQAKESIEAAAKKCGSFYVSNRWYGGMLTNMRTIRRSIEKLDYYEQIVEDGTINSFTKLEATKMKKVYDKIESGLGGIRDMDKLPGVVFVVDTIKEKITINEARKLNIPIVAMVDTNADPDMVDYIIPANDDAIRAIQLLSDIMANAVIEGKQAFLEGADIVLPEDKPDEKKDKVAAKDTEEKTKPEKEADKTEKVEPKATEKTTIKEEKIEPEKTEKKPEKKETIKKDTKKAEPKKETKKTKTEETAPAKKTEKKKDKS